MANDLNGNGTKEFTATRRMRTGEPTPPPVAPKTKPVTASVEAEQNGRTHKLEWEEKDGEVIIDEGSGRIREDGLDVEFVDGVPDHIADKYTNDILGLRDSQITGSARIDDERAEQFSGDYLWRDANIELEAVEGEKAYHFEWDAELADGFFPADKILGSNDATTVSGNGVVWYDEGEVKGDYPESVAEEVTDLVEQATGAEIDTPSGDTFDLPSWRDIESLDESFGIGVSYEVDLEAYDEGFVVEWQASNNRSSYNRQLNSSEVREKEAAYDFEQEEWAAGNPPEMIKSATESIAEFYRSE